MFVVIQAELSVNSHRIPNPSTFSPRYVPILPMVLVNGSEGIGTGWSSFVPQYNPREIAENITRMLDGQEPLPMTPWYRGFTVRHSE